MKLGLFSVRNKNIYITKAARYFLKIMFNNGAQFMGLTPRVLSKQQFVINYRFIFREIL